MRDSAPSQLTVAEQVRAIKTWRYLRLAIVVLVVGLFAAIAYERWEVGCYQTSISAYYYTPVRGLFVGSLVAIGVCMVCLQGSTDLEDTFLNLAGAFAPVVALVPTPTVGTCASVLGTSTDTNANVANNVLGLLVVSLTGLLILAAMVVKNLVDKVGPPGRPARLGYLVAVAVWVVAALVFALDRDLFVRTAHYAAAMLMFLFFLLTVVLNAVALKARTSVTTLRNRYGIIAAVMLLAMVAVPVAGLLGWAHWLLVAEATLIALFAAFWVTQTAELWHKGLR